MLTYFLNKKKLKTHTYLPSQVIICLLKSYVIFRRGLYQTKRYEWADVSQTAIKKLYTILTNLFIDHYLYHIFKEIVCQTIFDKRAFLMEL